MVVGVQIPPSALAHTISAREDHAPPPRRSQEFVHEQRRRPSVFVFGSCVARRMTGGVKPRLLR
jgi:hypothetical protein